MISGRLLKPVPDLLAVRWMKRRTRLFQLDVIK